MVQFIGVDVGSASVRAGVINEHGSLLFHTVEPITIFNPDLGIYEQKSEEIWDAVCKCVRNCLKDFDVMEIKGIGFDATCSLVLLDKNFRPFPLVHNPECNVIMWMDHRATAETELINSNAHESVLKYVGGKVFLEFQIPKLLWLKRNLEKKCYNNIGYVFDLVDYLVYRASGSIISSVCSAVSKFNFRPDTFIRDGNGWDNEFFKQIDIADMIQDGKISNTIANIGDRAGFVCDAFSTSTGLLISTVVAVSAIDAHTGALCCFGCNVANLCETMVIIAGTSSCHMTLSREPIFIPKMWGPQFSSILPEYWSMESGQSAVGSLIDHVLHNHPEFDRLKLLANTANVSIYDFLFLHLQKLSESNSVDELTKDIHVYPDFHGNRTPLGRDDMSGMISGLRLQSNLDNLAFLYLATIQALALSLRQILDVRNKHQQSPINRIVMCGGISQNNLFVQCHSNALQIPILIPQNCEAMLSGSSMLAACAAGYYKDLVTACQRMSPKTLSVSPDYTLAPFYEKKFHCFQIMQKAQLDILNIN